MSAHPFRLYAHRGARVERPENTMVAFTRALEVGANALELDVHVTRDGVLVVSHDPDGARMAGVPHTIAEMTHDEVRGWDAGHGFLSPDGGRPFAGQGIGIPTFEEVLRAFPETYLNVDLKVGIADAAVALIRKLSAQARVGLASFELKTLRRVRGLGYEGATSLARPEVWLLLGMPPLLARGPFRTTATAAQIPTSIARPFVVRRCHALGMRVDYWTVNDLSEGRALVALGADGIMTDDPAALAPLLTPSIIRGL